MQLGNANTQWSLTAFELFLFSSSVNIARKRQNWTFAPPHGFLRYELRKFIDSSITVAQEKSILRKLLSFSEQNDRERENTLNKYDPRSSVYIYKLPCSPQHLGFFLSFFSLSLSSSVLRVATVCNHYFFFLFLVFCRCFSVKFTDSIFQR